MKSGYKDTNGNTGNQIGDSTKITNVKEEVLEKSPEIVARKYHIYREVLVSVV